MNLAYINLFQLDLAGGDKLSHFNFTLIAAFHQFLNKRRISACVRLSGSSAWCFTLSLWFSLVHAFSQIIVQRIFHRHNKTCLVSGRVATRPLSLPRLPSSSLSSLWSPSFSHFSAQQKKKNILFSHPHLSCSTCVVSGQRSPPRYLFDQTSNINQNGQFRQEKVLQLKAGCSKL